MDYPASASDTGLDRETRYLRGTDDLLPDVVYLLPRCDEEVTVRKTLAETAQTFCRDTSCFTHEKSLDLTNDVKRYALTFPWPGELLTVLSVKEYTVTDGEETYNRELMPRSDYYVEDNAYGDNAYLNLWSAINAGNDSTKRLKIEMSLLPDFDEMIGSSSCALPDKWLRRWRQAIVAGTVAFLAGMEQKPWSNASLALAQQRKYERLQGEAWSKANGSRLVTGGASFQNPVPWC